MSATRILLILDPNRLLSAKPQVKTVESIADYVPACLLIRQTLRAKQKTKLELLVHHKTVGAWLREWLKPYGSDLVQVKAYTACDALEDRWGIQIPLEYEREIVRSGLLDINVTPREGQSFENVVLESFYHDFFAYPSFPSSQFARLLNQVDASRWTTNSKRPLVARIFHQRLDQWSKKETNEARKELINRLSRDISSLRQSFATYKVLRDYPSSFAAKVMGDSLDLFRKANIDPTRLTLEDIDLGSVVTEIEYYLNQQRSAITDPEAFYILLNQMSGYLLVEFNFIDKFLRNKADWLTTDLMRQIERRFAPLRQGLGSRFARLRNLIVVNAPPEPDLTWGPTAWLLWAVNQYMPHHRWLELQRRYDETSANNAAAFADWFYENFVDLKHGSPENFAFSALYRDRQSFVDNNKIALVILLDNFNYVFFSDLKRIFNQHDVSLASEQPVFSLPPSATEVGKASLVAVTGDLTNIHTKDYGKLVSDVWNKILEKNEKSAEYLSSIGELQNLTECKHDLYFLNYLPVDEALHESSMKIGMDHSERVLGLLETLVESIVEFAHRFSIEKQLVVYVISDHGSTRISKDVVNVLDKKFYKYIADLQHHRYVTLSKEQLDAIPQSVQAQCYIIDREKFKTNANYLAARRYYRFVDTDEDFYVHGGLTPEEIIVPFARFIFQPLSVIVPTLRLLNNQFRYSIKSILEFELGNPNDFPLENLGIRLIDIEAEEAFVDTLPAKNNTQIAFQAIFRKELKTGNNRDISVLIQYDCQGRTIDPVQNTFAISLKGMMETHDDFDL